MNCKIRTAKMKDLQIVQQLNYKLFEKEHREYDSSLNLNYTFSKMGTEQYKKKISSKNCCVLLAVVDNKPVGYLSGNLIKTHPYRNLSIVAELSSTFVLEEYRSKGIGKKLYDEFVKWCKKKKVSKITVESSSENKLAIKFYRNNKFRDRFLILERDL